jgi:hypothetical protein
MAEPVKFTVALMQYFAKDGRKMTATEYKELTYQDKLDLREMLINEGIDVGPVPEPKITTE